MFEYSALEDHRIKSWVGMHVVFPSFWFLKPWCAGFVFCISITGRLVCFMGDDGDSSENMESTHSMVEYYLYTMSYSLKCAG